jgi:hypothetical protein
MEEIQKTILKLQDVNEIRNQCSYFQIFHLYFVTNGQLKEKIKSILKEMPAHIWDRLSLTRNLDLDTLEEFKNNLNWDIISEKHPIYTKHFSRFGYRLDFNKIMERTKIPTFVIKKYFNLIDTRKLIKTQRLSKEAIMFILTSSSEIVITQQSVTFEDLTFEDFSSLAIWPFIVRYQDLTETILSCIYNFRVKHMRKCIKKMFWGLVGKYQKITLQTFYRFQKHLKYSVILKNEKIKPKIKLIMLKTLSKP